MEVKIGIQQVGREVVIDTTLSDKDVSSAVDAALAKGTPLHLNDEKGRTVIIPGDKIAYVEVAASQERRVGFSTP